MKFLISRASIFDDAKPINKKEVKQIEYRVGDRIRKVWVIEISSFKQLMGIIKKYGQIIISPREDLKGKGDSVKDINMEIAIYDDYVE